jgi:hypothetical protein
MECEYCHQVLKTKKTLAQHILFSPKCLEIQGKTPPKNICELCNTDFRSKSGLFKHRKICTFNNNISLEEYQKKIDELQKEIEKKYEKKMTVLQSKTQKKHQIEIKKLKRRIQELEKENEKDKKELIRTRKLIEDLATKPKVVNHNTTKYKLAQVKCDNILPLELENIEPWFRFFDYTRFKGGKHSFCKFIGTLIKAEIEGEVERNYVCTDTSRDKFHRLVEGRMWQKDNGAQYLNIIFDGMRNLIENHYERFIEEKKNASSDKQLENLEGIESRVYELYVGVMTKGQDRDVLVDFVRTYIRKVAGI